ncbi:MAG: hypothetical protein GWN00_19940 [Aliifodinibius sp.]|nr:hypothetical protein [Fodinibius sp.]NIY26993.1 hypothetical protein [Fodinibius sp.]
MGGIKRTPADVAFSQCIRERADWTCERCGAKHPKNSQGLHCSHHHSRGKWGIRFDPLNAEALCYGCHSLEGGTEQRRRDVLTDAEQDILFEKMNDTGLGKDARKTKGKGDIAKHYRNEFKRMSELRSKGVLGRIEFVGYF